VTAGTLAGSGAINVFGGVGSFGGGSGGGGRIDFSGIGTWSFEGTVSTAGGVESYYPAQRGRAGTISWPTDFSLTIGGAGNVSSVLMGYDGTNSYNFGSGTLTINSGGTLQIDGDPTVNAPDGGGPTITAGAITINTGGTFNADGLGFEGEEGPGAGTSSSRAGGGAYGGVGGKSSSAVAGGSIYGSAASPNALGSGGGNDTSSGSGAGGSGGGAFVLNVTNTLTVDGTLSADGTIGLGSHAGGGSGGTISIIAATLAGDGAINVMGAVGNGSSSSGGGGGGGGRLDFTGIGTWTYEGAISTAGGAQLSYLAQRGYAGTIDWPADFSLTLGSGASEITSIHMGYDGSNAYNFGSGTLTINSGGTLTIDGDPTVNAPNGGGPTITADTVTINTGGVFKADGLGFDSGEGPEAGVSGSNGGGGAHGGAGGDSSGGVLGGNTYGSATNPIFLGSGGGDDTSSGSGTGGTGGGAIILNVTNTLTVAGTLSAAGLGNGTGREAGGGAGGTIALTVATLAGDGSISANGGDGQSNGSSVGGGGGGAGRILVSGNTVNLGLTFNGTMTVTGGAKGGTGVATAGADGTIFIDPTISSAANQAFTVGDSATANSIITITNRAYTTTGTVISNTGELRVKIPAAFNMTWDSADLTAIIDGADVTKIYENGATQSTLCSGGSCTAAVTY